MAVRLPRHDPSSELLGLSPSGRASLKWPPFVYTEDLFLSTSLYSYSPVESVASVTSNKTLLLLLHSHEVAKVEVNLINKQIKIFKCYRVTNSVHHHWE